MHDGSQERVEQAAARVLGGADPETIKDVRPEYVVRIVREWLASNAQDPDALIVTPGPLGTRMERTW